MADDAGAMEAVAESSAPSDAVKNSQTAVDELNSRTSDVVSGELIGDGGPSSGSPVYERSQGIYIERVIHDERGGNSGSSTIWIDYGDEVMSYDSSGYTNEVVVEGIAYAIYHEQEWSNTGIDVIEAYEW